MFPEKSISSQSNPEIIFNLLINPYNNPDQDITAAQHLANCTLIPGANPLDLLEKVKALAKIYVDKSPEELIQSNRKTLELGLRNLAETSLRRPDSVDRFMQDW
jgi:hypothetical protein